MNFISRAYVSVLRNLGRSAVFLLVALVLGIAISGAISVQNAIRIADINIRQRMPIAATITLDQEALSDYYDRTGEWPQIESVSYEMFQKIGDFPYVKAYELSITQAILYSSELEYYIVDGFIMDEYSWMSFGNWESFALRGVQNSEMFDVAQGVIEITAGRTFNTSELNSISYVAIVSENFAATNNLHIGSSFVLTNAVWKDEVWELQKFYEDQMVDSRLYNFEVVGIFNPLVKFESDYDPEGNIRNESYALNMELENRIYVPNILAESVIMYQLEHYFPDYSLDLFLADNVFVLYGSDDVDNFTLAANIVIPEFYKVRQAESGLERFSLAMQWLNNLTITALQVAVAASIIVLSLLIIYLLHERKEEIGIYLALGEKRGKVVAQMVVEVVAVALIAIFLSLFVGSVLANTFSESILRNHMIAKEQVEKEEFIAAGGAFWERGMPEEMGFRSEVQYDVSLDAITVITFFAVSVATVLVATILPMFYVVRLNPKKILM